MDLSTFENFTQRELQRGVETRSETPYKWYMIRLRCYYLSGISGKIIKTMDDGKRIELMQRAYTFKEPIEFLNELKNYIDNHEDNLLKSLSRKAILKK